MYGLPEDDIITMVSRPGVISSEPMAKMDTRKLREIFIATATPSMSTNSPEIGKFYELLLFRSFQDAHDAFVVVSDGTHRR